MHQPLPKPQRLAIPRVIKRNTVLFALSQSFMGAGVNIGYGVGPLMMVALTGSASLAGLTVALFGLSRFLVAYPTGKVTDTFGRKPGIHLGLVLALIGAVLTGGAMLIQSAVALIAGMLIFGMGFNAAQQLRVAATDMYPPHMRALALGFVATGALLGLLMSPVLMWLGEVISARTSYEPMALPWLMMPTLILVGMVLVTMVQPDPKEIGQHLDRYYPDYVPPPRSSNARLAAFSARELWREATVRRAIISNAAATGNMAIVMVLTSLVLAHHGYSLTAIAISHMFHSAGMFAFMIPLGHLADRFGRQQVMYPGVVISLFGALFVTIGGDYWSVTLGTFLVGLGWSAANVASTALIADRTETVHRGRAIGMNDSAAGAMSVLAAIVTGPLVECTTLAAAGIAAVAIAVVPLAILAGSYLRRPQVA